MSWPAAQAPPPSGAGRGTCPRRGSIRTPARQLQPRTGTRCGPLSTLVGTSPSGEPSQRWEACGPLGRPEAEAKLQEATEEVPAMQEKAPRLVLGIFEGATTPGFWLRLRGRRRPLLARLRTSCRRRAARRPPRDATLAEEGRMEVVVVVRLEAVVWELAVVSAGLRRKHLRRCRATSSRGSCITRCCWGSGHALQRRSRSQPCRRWRRRRLR